MGRKPASCPFSMLKKGWERLDDMKEMWVDVLGYEGLYKVSNLGRVKSLDRVSRDGRTRRGRIISTKENNRGYAQVHLCKNGSCKMKLLHRLVAEAFIQNPNNLPQVNHKDEDKSNNCAINLEWCTNLYNRRYGTGYQRSVDGHDYKKISDANKKPVIQYDLKMNEICRWPSVLEAVKSVGKDHRSSSYISRACSGKRNQAYGYVWRYEL